jgi:Glyoxalase-like domain
MMGAVTRRSVVCGSAAMLALGQTRRSVRDVFDHLLFGVSDLDQGIDWFERHAGVRAVMGGVHPGRGTRNALVSLGGVHYLEIIAPDPAQTVRDRPFQLSTLTEPRLINFAVRTNNIDRTAASLRRAGVPAIGPREGSRRTASGGLLRWKALGVESRFQSGEIDPIPFFIEWASDSTHPSKNAPTGCVMEDLRFEHPRADELGAAWRAIGLEANVATGHQVRIVALVQTPKGHLELA